MPEIDDVKELGKRLSNWGRWGDEDEVGTLNFVTPETRIAAGRLIVSGKSYDLGMPFGVDGPFWKAGMARFNPIHLITVSPMDPRPNDVLAADDLIIMGLQSASHWDGLAHAGYDGSFYNDVPPTSVSTRHGAAQNSMAKAMDRLISRGVLLDVARLKGVDVLEESTEITADDLIEAERRQNVTVRSGDVLLVRTGFYRHFLAGDRDRFMGPEPGVGLSTLEWLYEREVAALAMDNWGVEVQPAGVKGWFVPFHMVAIRDMGMMLGENFNLEELAADCAEDGVYEFFFSGTGLNITNSVGSPVTPMAIK
jgi:kynurenine formamidase